MGTWDYKERAEVKLQLDGLKEDIDKAQSQKIEEIEKKFLTYINSTNKVINSYSDYSVREITEVKKDLSYLTENCVNLAKLVLKHRELRRKETSIIYLLILVSIIINGIACLLR